MAYDFRANQVRLNRIISSGSIPIIIYPSSSAADFAGNIEPSFSTAAVGSDVFLYVSGSSTAKTVFGGDIVVSGSLANGQEVVISGLYSHAEGFQTQATNNFAHAEGVATIATGYGTHAEGLGTFAGGDYSHVEGNGNATYAYGAHAEGNGTQAWAQNSHAEGNGTRTYGTFSHAEGYGSETYGTGSLAAGLYTVASGAVDGASPPTTVQAAFGKFNLRDNITSLFVVGDGLNDSNRHDVLRVNSGSVEVTGSFKVLGGITGSLSGTAGGNPFIVGAAPNVTVYYNGLGQWEITGSGGGGSNLWTELDSTNIYTTSSIEVARLSASLGAIITGSVVQGVGCVAINNSHAEGYQSDVSAGNYGHAEGYQTDVTGEAAHAEGNSTTAAGDYSHAEGINTDANGNYSHSEGNSTTAAGEGAHAEGKDTQAVGDYSHAEGSGSIAAGDYSHASGLNTEAFASYQTAVGKFNLTSNSDSLFVVGDGLNLSNRHDALRVNSGSVQVTGSLFVTQTMSASIISASYVRANSIDITPITAQLTIGGDGVNRASGSISGLLQSGSLMTAGTVGKFDIEVLAMDYNFATGASWKYSVTALWPLAGSFTVLASTEIAAEYGPTAGSYNPTNDWDVNFNDLGQIELTGSSPAFPSGGTSFYVQVTKKMIGSYGTIIS